MDGDGSPLRERKHMAAASSSLASAALQRKGWGGGRKLSHPQGFMKSKVKLPLFSSFSYHFAQFLSPPTNCESRKSANIPHQSPRSPIHLLKKHAIRHQASQFEKKHTHAQSAIALFVCFMLMIKRALRGGWNSIFACQSGGRDDGSSL